MLSKEVFEQNIVNFLNNHSPITEMNAKAVIDYLLEYQHLWSTMRCNLYAQIIINLGEAYRCLYDMNKAITFLEEQMGNFISQYQHAYASISQMFYYLGTYYALKLDAEKTLTAFKEHVRNSLLIPHHNYTELDLYSFRSCNKYTLDDLYNNTLTVATPKTFNDPLDCLIFPWLNYNNQKTTSRDQKMADEMLVEAYLGIKIRSFRRNKPLPTYNNETPPPKSDVGEPYEPLMWAHYADGHKGFCVKYVLPDSFTSSNLAGESGNCEISRMGNITYVSTVNLGDPLSINDAFYKKSKQWEYECEVRLLHYDPMWNGDFKPLKLPAGCVKEVYFGLKCSDEDKQQIRDALNGKQVKLYEIINDDDNFYKLTSQEA